MARIYFTREFTKGNLKGLRHNDSIEFESPERAVRFVRNINAKHEKGKLDYFICDRSFQKYWRY